MEKLCRSGYLNTTTGRCGRELKSLNKGKPCQTDQDCPTSDGLVFAKCLCGVNNKGTKYCDIEGGDNEWIEAKDKFLLYNEASFNCHTAEGFGKCRAESDVFKEYKCAEFKAKNYVKLIKNPDCFKDRYYLYPEFYEYSWYCNSHLIKMSLTFISVSYTHLTLPTICSV